MILDRCKKGKVELIMLHIAVTQKVMYVVQEPRSFSFQLPDPALVALFSPLAGSYALYFSLV
jgi:hypothetical protein